MPAWQTRLTTLGAIPALLHASYHAVIDEALAAMLQLARS